MDYFVSAENTPYHQWQLELLIESFKSQDLDDSLVIALAESDVSPKPEFCRNLWNHERLFCHTNIGKTRGYNKLNELYSLVWVLENGTLKQPFAIIKPDMVLNKAIVMDDDRPSVLFHPSPFFTSDYVEENTHNLQKYLPENVDLGKNWIPLGDMICFNDVPVAVLERTIIATELLAFEQIRAGRNEVWKDTDKAAWALNLMDYVGYLVFRGEYRLTMNMLDPVGEANFVHYENGLPPVFSKYMFQYLPPNQLSLGDPFLILSEHAPTPAALRMSELAKKCLLARTASM